MPGITYKDAGVDIKKADNLLSDIRSRIQGTFNPFVMNSIGGFAALTEVPSGYDKPVLVSSTDGVGTKLKVAFDAGKHDTVGIDLVAMSVNDVLTMGAKPYFFLDYFACGRIEDAVYKDVIAGVCSGCETSGCALIGGETAEMPSFYKDGEYDLAGFAMGFVEKDGIINGSEIREDDIVIGLASSGLHSNGFSLARKVLFEVGRLTVKDHLDGIESTLGEELLKPTRIYVRPMLGILENFTVHGMAHITGGGLPGNIERIIPDGLAVHICLSKEKVPPIFNHIMDLGNVPFEEMYSTFNMGIGYVLIAGKDSESRILDALSRSGENASIIGRVQKSKNKQKVLVSY
ncbi:MAG: phosphoribosylformylglycinamidine cyclo-ligase [Syntrophobacterales bacterium]|jgi:phosphoribosylformylglycinamidine cyclo-ligase|nr:phosphoribosylformylglycinamidine cyclo-ligase [Syntrophobacterales bacterium]